MSEKPDLSIPKDYSEPVQKEINFRLDQIPEKIRDKEIEIIELNNQGKEIDKKIQKRTTDAVLLYKRVNPKITQAEAESKLSIDKEINKFAIEKRKLIDKIEYEKRVNLNYLVNKFRGAQAISTRKKSLEK